MEFTVGEKYTRASIQETLNVPEDKRGGDWATGYTRFDGEMFIFSNVGAPGRTGHDYQNYWDGAELVWSAKTRSKPGQPLIEFMTTPGVRVHVFHRGADRDPFTYAGLGHAVEVRPTSPVVIRWAFEVADWADAMLGRDAIARLLAKNGFEVSAPGVKTQLARRGSIELYLKVDSRSWVVVVNPMYESCVTKLKAIDGVHRPTDRFFYHNSTMRHFPKRLAGGADEIPYGLDFDVSGPRAFEQFLSVLEDPKNLVASRVPPAGEEKDPATETEALRAARLGQQKFRADLLEKYAGRCALTGIDIPELLRASHIKRWADSTAKERHDPNNGLLLAIHVDGLFDRGLISFGKNGSILVSSKITTETLALFGIGAELRIQGLSVENHGYLTEHHKRYGYVR